MYAAIDVQYADPKAAAACVTFDGWSNEVADQEASVLIDQVAPYIPGQFYRRELPCILAVLEKVQSSFDAVLIDGYVWLGHDRPGLGQYLFEALGGTTPVIGVAKSAFADDEAAVPVIRGESANPLYVTAAGFDTRSAARHVEAMHGPYRMPTLLKSVDTLCRRALDIL